MANKLIDIEGIGSTYAKTLADAGLNTTDELLETAGSSSGRAKLAASTGLDEKQILEWVNRADLMRIKGVGSEYSDLLEASGVDTVKDLATRVPANLQAKMEEVNSAKKLTRRTPSTSEVRSWVAEAKTLKAMVTHDDTRADALRKMGTVGLEKSTPIDVSIERLQTARASVWKQILAIADSIPDGELDKLPKNGAEKHDVYLYGDPKAQ